ncbi:MAG TPA: tetratricopeptide repeat protein [Terriglobales bacterium]|nr:tetratricopeptide repeat protein [Terriglobales bacterium]
MALAIALSSLAAAQDSSSQTGKTVRHHRVAEAEDTSSAELTQAETALDKKDYTGAQALLEKFVASHPDNYRAWFDLGYAYTATHHREQAIEAYRKSVAANPQVFESNLNLGILLAETRSPDAGKYLRAATQLKPTANVDEGHKRAWLSLAHVLETSKPGDALQAYGEAARLAPRDPEPHLASALLLEKQNKFTEAEKEYQQAARLDPKSTEAIAGLVNLYTREKRLPEAEAALRRYLALQPNNGVAHVQLGRVLSAEGKTDEAAAELKTGLSLAPEDPAGQRELAELSVEAKKYPEAEHQYRALLAKQPNDAELHRALGAVLMHEQEFPQAEQQFLAAVKIKPDFGEAYGDLAFAANENKNYGAVIKALEFRAKYLPELPETYFLRATAYDHLREYKQASENYRQFLQVANGKFPDREWQAKHRLLAIDPKSRK